jgi:26S proteasome regulatory subunit N1
LQAFLDRSENDLKDPAARLLCLGLGLIFLGKGEAADAARTAIEAIDRPIKRYLDVTVETCAYAGSGSVLEVQKLLGVLSEHLEDDEKDPMKGIHQEVACLGLALVAMGEDLSTEMALRALDHVLQYGEVNIRRAVPLALAMLSVSNPRTTLPHASRRSEAAARR